MIKKITKESNELVDYIGDNYSKCLYLYLDYVKYGLTNENINFWTQYNKNDEIISIILMYYNGMHIYSKNKDIKYDEIVDLINEQKPSVICAEKFIIKNLSSLFKDYEVEYGNVRELNKIDFSFDSNEVIIDVSQNDLENIAKLILSDEMGNGYTYDNLLEQIITRRKEKYGRNYILKSDGIIVAHAGTGAEDDKVAIVNYVITKKEYRGKGYAKKILRKLCFDLINEGKRIFLINYSQESTILYDKLGFIAVEEIGKLNKVNK